MHVSRLLLSVGLVGVADINAVTPTLALSSPPVETHQILAESFFFFFFFE